MRSNLILIRVIDRLVRLFLSQRRGHGATCFSWLVGLLGFNDETGFNPYNDLLRVVFVDIMLWGNDYSQSKLMSTRPPRRTRFQTVERVC